MDKFARQPDARWVPCAPADGSRLARIYPGGKKQITNFYQKHGWKLVPAVSPGKTTQFVWRNIYEAERTAVLKANREKFERTLTPGQQVLWKEMSSFQFIYSDSGEQKALIASRQRIIDEFQASLTPEQKAEQAAIMDFTKANWK